MSRRRAVVWVAMVVWAGVGAHAADKKDKKEEKKPEPPRIVVAMPPAIVAGTTNKVRVRGNNLGDVTEARFTNLAFQVVLAIKAKTKVEVPKDADAKKVGDSQVELELSFPADASPLTNYFVIASTNGTTAAHPLIVLPAGGLMDEREPNGGFKQTQSLVTGRTLLGTVKEPADVDVFRLEGKAGQRFIAEVFGARCGSALDSILTLHTADGQILASNDDAAGSRDSILRFQLPADGACLLSLVDAHDRGGPTHVYLLCVSVDK